MTVLRPEHDPFYAPVVGPSRPGELLRFRSTEVKLDVETSAWQLVYGSTGVHGQPIAVSGTLLVPSGRWAGSGPRPILSYGVGVHGLGRDAAPSYLMRLGTEAETPLLAEALGRGWVVAVTDGDGLGMPGPHTYGAGLPGGHAMLDIVRASVHCVPSLSAAAPVLLWGYSEGGRYAAWAGELQPEYAPELDLRGIAAGGVPSDLRAVARAIDGGPFSGLGLAVLIGLAQAHQNPALWAILNERGQQAATHAATLDVVGLIVDHPEPMRHHTVREEPWDEPVWRALLDAERNGQRPPGAPLYLYHVAGDQIVPTELGTGLRDDYRALGADVVWAAVVAEEHLSGAFVGAPAAVEWLAGRLRA
jgi:secretory lipase